MMPLAVVAELYKAAVIVAVVTGPDLAVVLVPVLVVLLPALAVVVICRVTPLFLLILR